MGKPKKERLRRISITGEVVLKSGHVIDVEYYSKETLAEAADKYVTIRQAAVDGFGEVGGHMQFKCRYINMGEVASHNLALKVRKWGRYVPVTQEMVDASRP